MVPFFFFLPTLKRIRTMNLDGPLDGVALMQAFGGGSTEGKSDQETNSKPIPNLTNKNYPNTNANPNIIITISGIVAHFTGENGEFGGLKCTLAR